MSDNTKPDADDLKNEHPDYVEDLTGDAGDEDVQPQVGTDVMDPGSAGEIEKPVVHLDEEKVRKHDREKGA